MLVGADRDERGKWLRVLAAVVLVGAPIVILGLLIFAGDQVAACLGSLGGCSIPPQVIAEGPIPDWVAYAALGILGPLWVLVVGLVIWHVWSVDRHRLLRGTAVVAGGSAVTAVLIGLLRLSEARRLRDAAEDAVLSAIGLSLLLVPIVLAWAILTVRDQAGSNAGPLAGGPRAAGHVPGPDQPG